MNQPFCDKFPEWELCSALDQACQKEARFWHDAVVRVPGAPNHPISMASLYRTTATPKCMTEASFPADGPALYGITDVERYQKNLLSLRPDFKLEVDGDLLVLLEAKGGQPPPRRGVRCKEDNYYDLLRECSKPPERGFYYVVPQRSGEGFLAAVTERFSSSTGIHTGVIYWEDLLQLMGDALMDVAIGQVLKITEGIRDLRTWRTNRNA